VSSRFDFSEFFDESKKGPRRNGARQSSDGTRMAEIVDIFAACAPPRIAFLLF
jgi:hypothetical protein